MLQASAMAAGGEAAAVPEPPTKYVWDRVLGKFCTAEQQERDHARMQRFTRVDRRKSERAWKRRKRMVRKRSRMPKRPHGRRGPKDAKIRIPR
jgi:hypothetical protein